MMTGGWFMALLYPQYQSTSKYHAPCEVSFPIRSCILVGKDAMVTDGIQGAISGPSKWHGKAGWFVVILMVVYGGFIIVIHGGLWWLKYCDLWWFILIYGGFRLRAAYWIDTPSWFFRADFDAAKVRWQVHAVAWQVVAHAHGHTHKREIGENYLNKNLSTLETDTRNGTLVKYT